MPFVSTEQVLEQVRQILEERFDKRRKELSNGPEQVPPVRAWLLGEFDFPGGDAVGDYPKGIVGLDDSGRTSERREQDSGETAKIGIVVRVFFSAAGLARDVLERTAMRYGDGIYYTLMREALVKRPKDSTVLPGLFRVWPDSMRIGQPQAQDLYGCEVRATVTIDSSFDAAA